MKKIALVLTTIFLAHSVNALEPRWKRVVTLNPMVAEWTAEILGEKLALQTVVGSSEFSQYPEYLKGIPSVGAYTNIQIEKIVSLKPDLVIASQEYNHPAQVEQLKKLKLNVVVMPEEKFETMADWIKSLEQLLGKNSGAANRWKLGLAELKPKKNIKAFYQIQFHPLITVGAKSFLTDAFSKIGYENIFGDIPQSYPKISREAVLEKMPQEVLIFEMVKNQEDLNSIKKAWGSTRVRVLSGDDFSRCSLRLLKGLKKLQGEI